MNSARIRGRAFTLVFVLAATMLVGGIIAVLADYTLELHRRHQAEQTRTTVRLLAESARSYARVHGDAVPAEKSPVTVELNIAALLPQGTTGLAHLTFFTDEAGTRAEVAARAQRRSHVAKHGFSFTP